LSLNESVCSLTMKFYPDDSSAFNDPIYGEFTFCSKDKIESGNKFESWKDSKNRHYNLSIIYNDIIRPSLEEDKELSSDQSVCLLMMKLYPDYSTALEDPLDEKYTFCYGISKGYDEILMQNNILTIFPSKDEVQEKTTLSNQILKKTKEYYDPVVWLSKDNHNWCLACTKIPDENEYLQSLWLIDEGSPHSYVEKNTRALLGLDEKEGLDTMQGKVWKSDFWGDIGAAFLRESETCTHQGVQGINLLGNDIKFYRINFGAFFGVPYKSTKMVFFHHQTFIEYVKKFYESVQANVQKK